MKEFTMTKSQYKEMWKKVLAGTGNDLVNELVRTCPVDTGFLKNTIRAEQDKTGINIIMADYWKYVEFGTVAHEILPVNAKALHFKINGRDVYAKRVWHPGTDAQPFIRVAINTKLKKILYDNITREASNVSST